MAIVRTALKRYYMQVSHALSHWVSANCTVLTMGRRHLREQILVLGLLAAEQKERLGVSILGFQSYMKA